MTPRQQQLLAFIRSYWAEKHCCPSYEEMMRAVNLRSKSGIHRMILGLEERGFIRRLQNRARSIEIVCNWSCPHCYQPIDIGRITAAAAKAA